MLYPIRWIAFAIGLYAFAWATMADADVCPAELVPECADRPLWSGLEGAGVTPEEREAVAIVVNGMSGYRTQAEYYPATDHMPLRVGWPHLTGLDPLDIGTDDEAANLAVLYGPWGGRLTLLAWRGRVGPAARMALARGVDTTAARVIANSLGSQGFIDLAESVGWDEAALLLAYAGDSPRRQRRVRMIQAG